MTVALPWLRRGVDPGGAAAFLRGTGGRLRLLAWTCFAVLLVTGLVNLWLRGVRIGDFVDPRWLGSPAGSATVAKLAGFALVLAVSAVHDFVVGPRSGEAARRDPASSAAVVLRRCASLLGRASALLALIMVALGVILVRGWPIGLSPGILSLGRKHGSVS